MTKITVLVLILLPCLIIAQGNNEEEELNKYKDKEITIITYHPKNNNDCRQKAIKVTIRGVWIDSCFDIHENVFSPDNELDFRSNDFYFSLIRLTEKDFLKMQSDLDNFENTCPEHPKPILIMLDEKGKSFTFGLKHYVGCYPDEHEYFLTELEKLITMK